MLTYVDGDHRLFEKARNMTVASKFKERICLFRSKGIPSVSNMKSRRQRIADIHNELGKEIGNTKYILGIEDDTIVPSNTLKQLMKTYDANTFAGFVSGVEIGRWGFNHIGAWQADDIYDPTTITSIVNAEGVVEVDAAGMYCFLTKKEQYVSHHFQPFGNALGPDVDFGLSLRRQGLKNYVDFSVKCEHWNIKEPVTFSNSIIDQVQIQKIGDTWATGRVE